VDLEDSIEKLEWLLAIGIMSEDFHFTFASASAFQVIGIVMGCLSMILVRSGLFKYSLIGSSVSSVSSGWLGRRKWETEVWDFMDEGGLGMEGRERLGYARFKTRRFWKVQNGEAGDKSGQRCAKFAQDSVIVDARSNNGCFGRK
jgi:hypothetical protein